MKKKNFLKYIVAALIVVITVAVVQGTKCVISKIKQTVLSGPPSVRRLGPDTAPVHVVEFIEYSCGPCGRGSKWLEEFIKQHPQDIVLEVEYFSLHKSPLGPLSFQFAECALRQGKFWMAHRLIFERQYQWVPMRDPQPLFRLIGQEIGLDFQALDKCLKDAEVIKVIERSRFKGEVLGVKATPTYVVNGDVVVGTVELEKKVRQILEVR